jgi:hypothetical protein
MNLFSPTAAAATVVSPSAASSYAEAAEALAQDNNSTSELPSSAAPLASDELLAGEVHAAEPQEQQLDELPGVSGGGA